MSSAEIFLEIIAGLQQAHIPYMVVGSFASNLYGIGRATQDIGLVVFGDAGPNSHLVKSSSSQQVLFRLEYCPRSLPEE